MMKRNITIWTGFFRIMGGPSGGHSFVLFTMRMPRTLLHRKVIASGESVFIHESFPKIEAAVTLRKRWLATVC
jgi:hypothetical protein